MSQLILKAVHFTCFNPVTIPGNHWGTWQAHYKPALWYMYGGQLCHCENDRQKKCLNNSVKTIKTVFKS